MIAPRGYASRIPSRLRILDRWGQKNAKLQIDVVRRSICNARSPLRHARPGRRDGEPDLRPVRGYGERLPSHQFDCWPVLTEEVRCVVEIVRLHSNTAGLSAGSDPYLKVKIEADGFRVFLDRLIIQTHLVSPPVCVVHFKFRIWIFVGRDYGARESATVASLDDEDC
jgi:hypothetical protein